MDANFFYYSIYDRFMIDLYKGNHVHVSICLWTFSLKNFLETIDWIFTKFHRNVSKIKVKKFSSLLQKNQACGAMQVLKHLWLCTVLPPVFN